ncbi:MAG: PPOX class F420-dependent oxidoreductase [Ardenticatenaceae bacterium]|nr:PPOX class F420-dependent oxidoreductase [Ardenticatenaceae bacterium]
MNLEDREQFLAKTRLGILTTLRRDGSPISVPVWFDWDGTAVRVFTGKDSTKVKRLRHDPRLTLLVVNDVGEPEAWVAFEGRATIENEGGIELAEKLAAKYWDLTNPQHKATLENWQAHGDTFCLITLHPDRIRTYDE